MSAPCPSIIDSCGHLLSFVIMRVYCQKWRIGGDWDDFVECEEFQISVNCSHMRQPPEGWGTMIGDVTVIRAAKSLHSSFYDCYISYLGHQNLFIQGSSLHHLHGAYIPSNYHKKSSTISKKAAGSPIINSYWKVRCITWQLGPKKADNQWKMSPFWKSFLLWETLAWAN